MSFARRVLEETGAEAVSVIGAGPAQVGYGLVNGLWRVITAGLTPRLGYELAGLVSSSERPPRSFGETLIKLGRLLEPMSDSRIALLTRGVPIFVNQELVPVDRFDVSGGVIVECCGLYPPEAEELRQDRRQVLSFCAANAWVCDGRPLWTSDEGVRREWAELEGRAMASDELEETPSLSDPCFLQSLELDENDDGPFLAFDAEDGDALLPRLERLLESSAERLELKSRSVSVCLTLGEVQRHHVEGRSVDITMTRRDLRASTWVARSSREPWLSLPLVAPEGALQMLDIRDAAAERSPNLLALAFEARGTLEPAELCASVMPALVEMVAAGSADVATASVWLDFGTETNAWRTDRELMLSAAALAATCAQVDRALMLMREAHTVKGKLIVMQAERSRLELDRRFTPLHESKEWKGLLGRLVSSPDGAANESR